MPLWSLRTYLTISGRDPVREWYEGLRPTNRAIVRTDLRYLRDQPPAKWERPWYGTLSKKGCSGLGEVRLKLDKVEWRIIGFFGPGRQEFTMVAIAREKDRKFIPIDTCQIAQARKAEILNRGSKSLEWDL
jgi:hypothetical protein